MIQRKLKMDEKQKISILSFLPLMFIILAFYFDSPTNIIKGLYQIVINPDLLLTDYIAVGGAGATLINSAILTLINIYILYKLNIKITGLPIAAIFTIAGFSFFGKNIVNVWPIYIGGYLYCKHQGVKFKSIALIIMFGTALAPLVSQLMYGTTLSNPIALLVGITLGILTGFILPTLASHMIRFHDGYNLYNVGFTAGVIGTVIISILRSYGAIIEAQMIISKEYDLFFKLFFTFFSLLLLFIGYWMNGKSLNGYRELLWYSGRTVTDFTQLTSYGITFINMGIMGMISLIYIIMSGGIINGPIIGGILTVMGFSAFGKHPKNTIPILLGVYMATLTKLWEPNSTTVIIAGLFGTTLAPIPGTYGWGVGILTGFLHLSVVMNVGYLHGGINLYNNGFAGGIVAGVLTPIMDAFTKD